MSSANDEFRARLAQYLQPQPPKAVATDATGDAAAEAPTASLATTTGGLLSTSRLFSGGGGAAASGGAPHSAATAAGSFLARKPRILGAGIGSVEGAPPAPNQPQPSSASAPSAAAPQVFATPSTPSTAAALPSPLISVTAPTKGAAAGASPSAAASAALLTAAGAAPPTLLNSTAPATRTNSSLRDAGAGALKEPEPSPHSQGLGVGLGTIGAGSTAGSTRAPTPNPPNPNPIPTPTPTPTEAPLSAPLMVRRHSGYGLQPLKAIQRGGGDTNPSLFGGDSSAAADACVVTPRSALDDNALSAPSSDGEAASSSSSSSSASSSSSSDASSDEGNQHGGRHRLHKKKSTSPNELSPHPQQQRMTNARARGATVAVPPVFRRGQGAAGEVEIGGGQKRRDEDEEKRAAAAAGGLSINIPSSNNLLLLSSRTTSGGSRSALVAPISRAAPAEAKEAVAARWAEAEAAAAERWGFPNPNNANGEEADSAAAADGLGSRAASSTAPLAPTPQAQPAVSPAMTAAAVLLLRAIEAFTAEVDASTSSRNEANTNAEGANGLVKGQQQPTVASKNKKDEPFDRNSRAYPARRPAAEKASAAPTTAANPPSTVNSNGTASLVDYLLDRQIQQQCEARANRARTAAQKVEIQQYRDALRGINVSKGFTTEAQRAAAFHNANTRLRAAVAAKRGGAGAAEGPEAEEAAAITMAVNSLYGGGRGTAGAAAGVAVQRARGSPRGTATITNNSRATTAQRASTATAAASRPAFTTAATKTRVENNTVSAAKAIGSKASGTATNNEPTKSNSNDSPFHDPRFPLLSTAHRREVLALYDQLHRAKGLLGVASFMLREAFVTASMASLAIEQRRSDDRHHARAAAIASASLTSGGGAAAYATFLADSAERNADRRRVIDGRRAYAEAQGGQSMAVVDACHSNGPLVARADDTGIPLAVVEALGDLSSRLASRRRERAQLLQHRARAIAAASRTADSLLLLTAAPEERQQQRGSYPTMGAGHVGAASDGDGDDPLVTASGGNSAASDFSDDEAIDGGAYDADGNAAFGDRRRKANPSADTIGGDRSPAARNPRQHIAGEDGDGGDLWGHASPSAIPFLSGTASSHASASYNPIPFAAAPLPTPLSQRSSAAADAQSKAKYLSEALAYLRALDYGRWADGAGTGEGGREASAPHAARGNSRGDGGGWGAQQQHGRGGCGANSSLAPTHLGLAALGTGTGDHSDEVVVCEQREALRAGLMGTAAGGGRRTRPRRDTAYPNQTQLQRAGMHGYGGGRGHGGSDGDSSDDDNDDSYGDIGVHDSASQADGNGHSFGRRHSSPDCSSQDLGSTSRSYDDTRGMGMGIGNRSSNEESPNPLAVMGMGIAAVGGVNHHAPRRPGGANASTGGGATILKENSQEVICRAAAADHPLARDEEMARREKLRQLFVDEVAHLQSLAVPGRRLAETLPRAFVAAGATSSGPVRALSPVPQANPYRFSPPAQQRYVPEYINGAPTNTRQYSSTNMANIERDRRRRRTASHIMFSGGGIPNNNSCYADDCGSSSHRSGDAMSSAGADGSFRKGATSKGHGKESNGGGGAAVSFSFAPRSILSGSLTSLDPLSSAAGVGNSPSSTAGVGIGGGGTLGRTSSVRFAGIGGTNDDDGQHSIGVGLGDSHRKGSSRGLLKNGDGHRIDFSAADATADVNLSAAGDGGAAGEEDIVVLSPRAAGDEDSDMDEETRRILANDSGL